MTYHQEEPTHQVTSPPTAQRDPTHSTQPADSPATSVYRTCNPIFEPLPATSSAGRGLLSDDTEPDNDAEFDCLVSMLTQGFYGKKREAKAARKSAEAYKRDLQRFVNTYRNDCGNGSAFDNI